MPQGIDKRILRSRKALLCALPQILAEKPLESVTVREIAEVAGINRKTFYAHYTTPAELHDDLAEEVSLAVIRRMGERSEHRPADFVAAMSKLAREYPREFAYFIQLDNLSAMRTTVFGRLSVLLAERLFPTSEHGVLQAAGLIGSAVAIYGVNYASPTPLPLPVVEEVHLSYINHGLV